MLTNHIQGGNFSSISPDDPKALKYDKLSFINLQSVFKQFGEAAGLKRLPITEYWDTNKPSTEKIESLKTYIPDLHIIDPEDLPESAVYGIKYTTYNFFAPKFIVFLKHYLTAHGVTFVRRKLDHLDDAFTYNPAAQTKVVFNCTGIGARSLPGVADTNVYPTRGQIVIAHLPHVNENVTMWGPEFSTYIIPRPFSGGLVVLGGYQQKNNWSGDTYSHETESILERTTTLFPHILTGSSTGKVEIVREAAGLRPSRIGGPRIEREAREDGKYIIHNYGASGTGFQAGYGMALEAIAYMDNDNHGSSSL